MYSSVPYSQLLFVFQLVEVNEKIIIEFSFRVMSEIFDASVGVNYVSLRQPILRLITPTSS